MLARRRSWRRIAGVAVVVLSVGASVTPAGAVADVTGVVTNLRGVPLADTVVSLDGRTLTTSADGRFRLVGATPGPVTFTRVGYAPRTVTWDGDAAWIGVTLAPRMVRSIHVTGTKPATDAGFNEMVSIASSTAVNSLMIDVKSESGLVFHQTGVPTVADVGAGYSNPWDLAERTRQAHDAGLYVVVRIVTFEDPIAARARPGWAVTEADGSLLVHSGQYWLDPTDPAAQQYAIDLAVEACSMGVDEVQFDYVRFPTGDKTTMRFDGPSDATGRQATITAFAERARSLLQPMGCATAVDIFGFITNKTHEGGIGQQLEDLAATVDVISPMIYPSHYAAGWYGYSVPNDHPGPIVRNASQDALDRLGQSRAILRPWLQDFWYTAAQVETQIVTIDDLELGWMLWNVSSNFTVSGIPADGELTASESTPDATLLPWPASGFFDVPDGARHDTAIGWLADEGITNGCNPPWGDFFCPTDHVTRGQMAALLVRALDLATAGAGDTFSDDNGSVFEADIEALATAGITLGCDDGRFCPHAAVTRAQVATFLARALGLSLDQPTSSFVDDNTSVHEAAIAAIHRAGVANGCTTSEYCPASPLRREHMAAFLYRALAA